MCSLTTPVFRERAGAGSPKQVERLVSHLETEVTNRDATKRAPLPRRCGLPAPEILALGRLRDDQMAAAIDRVVHHRRLVQFRGESYRVRYALMQGG